MKTAMQELIQEIKDLILRGEIIVDYDLFCAEFLEKEKNQIIDAYSEGADYYNKTFKQK